MHKIGLLTYWFYCLCLCKKPLNCPKQTLCEFYFELARKNHHFFFVKENWSVNVNYWNNFVKIVLFDEYFFPSSYEKFSVKLIVEIFWCVMQTTRLQIMYAFSISRLFFSTQNTRKFFKYFPSNLIKQKKASRKIVKRTSPILDGSPRHHRLDVVIAWCGTQNLNSYHERIGTGKMIFEAMAPKIASKNHF